MNALFSFIDQMTKKYGIDESHGLKHAKGTLARAQLLLKSFQDISFEERKMALYAAALHDMCDSKYSDVDIASFEIKEWLIEQGWRHQDATALVAIVITMSYSKLKKLNSDNKGGPLIYPNHGIWQRAYHIARHADLLEAYIVARCKMYNEEIYPEKSEDEHWLAVRSLFDSRVFNYVKDGWIFFPSAITSAAELEREAMKCFETRSLNWPEPILDIDDPALA